MALSRDHVVWAYRLILDREPENEDVIGPKMRGYDRTADLRHDFMTSPEFLEKNHDAAQMAARTIVIKPLASGIRIFIDLADHAIGLNVLRGRFEDAELAFAQRHVRPGDLAIDAGAHIGIYALHLAQAVGPGGHVYAFEPFPANAELLSLSVAENGFDQRVTVTRAAVSDHDGTGDLVYAEHTLNSGGAFVVDAGAAGLPGHARLAVGSVRLDGLSFPRRVAFLKLDVEGAEPRVLKGANRLLEAQRPVLLCEIHHEQLARVSGSTAHDLFAWLGRMRYEPHEILADGALGARLSAPPTAPVSTVAFVVPA